jgi:hypothetical protein
VMSTIFWDIKPCSLVEVDRLRAVSFVYSSTLKPEAAHFSKTSVNVYQTTWLTSQNGKAYNHSHRRMHLKFHHSELNGFHLFSQKSKVANFDKIR